MKGKNTKTIVIAALAGFLGGIAPHAFFSSRTVHAQTFGPAPLPRPGKHPGGREVAAQRFLLVDSSGHVFGVMAMNHGRPEIDLYNSAGKIIFRAPGHFGLSPTSQ
ncbi:MAG: hypothetical protein ACRD3Y_00210 [Bryobacteraceae bacterium]